MSSGEHNLPSIIDRAWVERSRVLVLESIHDLVVTTLRETNIVRLPFKYHCRSLSATVIRYGARAHLLTGASGETERVSAWVFVGSGLGNHVRQQIVY